MKFGWIVIAVAGLAVAATDSTVAHAKKKAQRQCVDHPYDHSLSGFVWNPPPQPNGCTPPVYADGVYVGQDPDPFIRSQLLRDPRTGFSPY